MHWILSKWSIPYIKTFNTLLRVRIVFQILSQLDIFAQIQENHTE